MKISTKKIIFLIFFKKNTRSIDNDVLSSYISFHFIWPLRVFETISFFMFFYLLYRYLSYLSVVLFVKRYLLDHAVASDQLATSVKL
jgi:hypothetical protein